jgi:putative two-component system response regulator
MLQKPKILIVDDLSDNIELIQNFFIGESYNFSKALNGEEALLNVEAEPPDLILLDVLMPKMNGYEVCGRLKNDPKTRLIPIIMITGLDDTESRVRGYNLGVNDFISKPINIYELKARVASLIKLKQYTDQLEYAERILFSLALAVEAKDPYTKGHCNRLANYGMMLSERMGLSEPEISAIRRGCILHDIGKLAVQDNILLKPGPLTDKEFEVIRTHPEVGEKICKPLRTLDDVLPIIRHHQERYNGSGYPDGLAGEDIPIMARIVAIVDCYDALTTDRPYRRAITHGEALNILDYEAEQGLWDKIVYQEFKNVLKAEDIHERVKTEVLELRNLN